MKKSWVIVCFVFLYLLCSCGVKKSLSARPDLTGLATVDTARIKINDSTFRLNNNSLRKNEYGIWELYLEGTPLERGLAAGSLSRELIKIQEAAFIGKVTELVPSAGYLKFLSKLVAWYNRKLHLHVPEEYKQEIYGLSRFGSKEYDTFAEPYVRMLYAHGAHDIGHALQDLMLVGCTSFAAWNERTADGELLLGRNFDFYAGDDFAKEKMVVFMKPDKGHQFMMYGWAGMMGAVSGMNDKGLTVTINAGKSKIPLMAKTPISIVTREILQYASTLDEAIAIAKKREVFVSESIMVGSALDKKAILIEVAPHNLGVYEVTNESQLVCSNHFQSEPFFTDQRNQKAIAESHSLYRYQRMTELLNQKEKLTPENGVAILRDRKGLGDTSIGYGNEKALNQLLAFHGIVFKPESLQVWLSSNPYQLGAFVGYDLTTVFEKLSSQQDWSSVANEALLIAKDPFVNTKAYRDYEVFRTALRRIENLLATGAAIPEDELQTFVRLNPDYWITHYTVGRYYYNHKAYKAAIIAFKKALRCEVTTLPDSKMLQSYIKKSYRKL
ncbi:C45 family autoproteolytic acyltransferase/hydrolase [Aquimarina sp. W85]|uniref:C45 family autoproteolytic acyltransferase/hydolase n=1 Tax=Aquimarina rhodophyticola TaxID=3342246 RepID=UPI00366CD6C0